MQPSKLLLLLFGVTIAVSSCKKKDSDGPQEDKIRASLGVSKTAYDNATANNWVSVTETEYNNLLVIVSGSAKYGAPEIFMNTTPATGWSASYTIAGNNNVAKVPASNYIIGWSVKTANSSSTAAGSKLKVSTTQTSGYIDYGGPLPSTGTLAATTRVYFVLKNPGNKTPAAPAYTGVYNGSNYFLANINGASHGPEYYKSGDSDVPATAFPSDSYSQVISTGTKQW
jgi:hypothetical protein